MPLGRLWCLAQSSNSPGWRGAQDEHNISFELVMADAKRPSTRPVPATLPTHIMQPLVW